jgi:hypothetical protein
MVELCSVLRLSYMGVPSVWVCLYLLQNCCVDWYIKNTAYDNAQHFANSKVEWKMME